MAIVNKAERQRMMPLTLSTDSHAAVHFHDIMLGNILNGNYTLLTPPEQGLWASKSYNFRGHAAPYELLRTLSLKYFTVVNVLVKEYSLLVL